MNNSELNVLGGVSMYYQFSEADYKALLSKSQYSVRISKILRSKKTLTHDQLRQELGIEKNNLSNIIKKLEPFDIIFARKIGKNVFYSLSPKGIEFYDYVKAQDQIVDVIDTITEKKEKQKKVEDYILTAGVVTTK